MSDPWIKICGLRDAASVAHCLALQVSAIGFVFAPSVRQVSIVEALRLADPARGRAQIVAVFRGLTEAWQPVIKEFEPDLLQADWSAIPAGSCGDGMIDNPEPRAWLPVLRDGEAIADSLPSMLLYEGVVSGSGLTADWQQAATLTERTRLVLAGGLTPDNVTRAISRVRPFGVDVSSGVERASGVKCPEKIRDFVLAARGSARA